MWVSARTCLQVDERPQRPAAWRGQTRGHAGPCLACVRRRTCPPACPASAPMTTCAPPPPFTACTPSRRRWAGCPCAVTLRGVAGFPIVLHPLHALQCECGRLGRRVSAAYPPPRAIIRLLCIPYANPPLQLAPVPSSGIESMETDSFVLHCFQTPTGVKFIVSARPGARRLEEFLRKVYELYADFVLKVRTSPPNVTLVRQVDGAMACVCPRRFPPPPRISSTPPPRAHPCSHTAPAPPHRNAQGMCRCCCGAPPAPPLARVPRTPFTKRTCPFVATSSTPPSRRT
jgi:hypothetical protein